MKQFLKSSAFITLPILYLAYYRAYSFIFARLKSNFLHYSKMSIMYDIILISHCLFVLCCIFLLFRLFANKAKLKLLKALVVIFFALYSGMLFLGDYAHADRSVLGQITREKRFNRPGDKFIRNVKSSQDKRLPTLDNWQSYAFDKEEDNVFSYINYNKHVSGLLFENIPPQTVLLVEEGATLLKGIDEAAFKDSCNGEFLFLYTADSRIVVYIKQSDEYRYFDSYEIADIVWVP